MARQSRAVCREFGHCLLKGGLVAKYEKTALLELGKLACFVGNLACETQPKISGDFSLADTMRVY